LLLLCQPGVRLQGYQPTDQTKKFPPPHARPQAQE
jgi:hypothetical protein